MSLKIIGAGLGRTGTHTLALALEKLNFGPCYTVNTLKKNPLHVAIWNEAISGKTVDWQSLYQGYGSAVEWPTVSFFPQVLQAFPKAKVILTLRDAKEWYESARATIFEALELSQYNPNPPGKNRPAVELTRRLVLEIMFQGKYKDEAQAIEIYNQHNLQVREIVSEDRLLIYKITEGWLPLCEFVGVAVPNEPFPKSNDRTKFISSAPEWMKALKKQLGR
jgi:hypothetical protein